MKIYDVAIIGGGPAGLSAGIYTRRSNLSTLIFEGNVVGGTLAELKQIDNYPGFMGDGKTLAKKMYQQAKKLKNRFVFENVENILPIEKKNKSTVFSLHTQTKEFKARSIIIASGQKRVALGIEKDYIGKGVSYCAVCDGFFYSNSTVAVYGAGQTAVSDAIYLSNIAKTVYLITNKSLFLVESSTLEKVKKIPNIKLLTNTVINKLNGENALDSINTFDLTTLTTNTIQVEGLFIANGVNPNIKPFKKVADSNENGIVTSNVHTKTNGVFACGDAVSGNFKQVVVACATGAECAEEARIYLTSFVK